MIEANNLNNRACWICENNSLEIIPPKLENSCAAICRVCGFIQLREKKLEDEKKANPHIFSRTSKKNYVSTLERRPLKHSSRFASFLKIIKSSIDLNKINTCMDVGCHSGLFSEIMRAYYPHIEYFGIDPDPIAIDYAKKNYKGIHFEQSSLEDFDLNCQKFDLILHTGGFYRMNQPVRMLEKLHSMLTDHGYLFMIMTIMLEDANTADSGFIKSYEEFYRRGVRLIFNKELYEDVISQFFTIEKVCECRPFLFRPPKKVPLYFLRKNLLSKEKRSLIKPKRNYYQENISAYLKYFHKQSLKNINESMPEHTEYVAILGVSSIAEYLADLLAESHIETKFFIHPLAYLHRNYQYKTIPVMHFDEIYSGQRIDAILVLDFHDTVFSIAKTIPQTKNIAFYKVQNGGPNNNNYFFVSGSETYLKHPFEFEPLWQ